MPLSLSHSELEVESYADFTKLIQLSDDLTDIIILKMAVLSLGKP